jgi:hypothetical protein
MKNRVIGPSGDLVVVVGWSDDPMIRWPDHPIVMWDNE